MNVNSFFALKNPRLKFFLNIKIEKLSNNLHLRVKVIKKKINEKNFLINIIKQST